MLSPIGNYPAVLLPVVLASSKRLLNSSKSLYTYLKGFNAVRSDNYSFSYVTLIQNVKGSMKKAFSWRSSQKFFTFLNSSCLFEISECPSTWFTVCKKLCESRSKLICLDTGLHRKWKWPCVWLASSTQASERVSMKTRRTNWLLLPGMI